jgi:MFS family permease
VRGRAETSARLRRATLRARADACVNMPVSSVAGALTRTTLSSLFSKAVPRDHSGAALGVLDVLNSAVGIVAPMYGGLLLQRVGVEAQPAFSALHYVLLLALAFATIARRRAAPKDAAKVE